jgi:hypothetical protein
MADTVISKRTLARIIKEGKEDDKGTSASFSTPWKSRPKEKVSVVDAFDADVIRRLFHNFHVTQKQPKHLQTRVCFYWWDDYPIRQLALCEKNFGWDLCLAVAPRSVGIALTDGPCDLRGGRKHFG